MNRNEGHVDDVQLRDCPSCGAPNHPARHRCGRCRVRLAPPARAADVTEAIGGLSREQPPEAHTPPAPVRPKPEAGTAVPRVVEKLMGTGDDTQPLEPVVVAAPESRPLSARPVLSVTLAGLVLGIAVGVIGAIAYFSNDDQPADTIASDALAFDSNAYPGSPEPLAAATVTATSFLPPAGDNHYEPTLVLDADPTTAWNSDGTVRNDGIGEVLTLELAEPAWITTLEFANGYQRDDVRFLANARIARAAIVFDDGSRVNVVLLDQTGFQRLPLPGPMLTTSVRVEILEVFPGDTYHDLAVSEFSLIGHVATGADREHALQVAAQDAATSQS